MRRTRDFIPLAGVLVLALLSIPLHAASEIDQLLRDQYQGKIFVLRGFQANDVLRYDSLGSPLSTNSGDWTSDGLVLVNKIGVSEGSLMISAGRLLVFSGKNGFQLDGGGKKNKKPKKWNSVEIQAALSSDNPSSDQLEALLAKIFLIPQDSLAELVPEYWNPCIREGLNGKNTNCRFSAELLAIPGIAPGPTSSQPAASTEPDSKSTSSPVGPEANPSEPAPDGTYRPGHGVSPPRQLYAPEPPFGELARQAKREGTVILSMILNTEGKPTKVRISTPLGAGLDASAVQTVSTWRFNPAMKDGNPVPVRIQVEVNFHLY